VSERTLELPMRSLADLVPEAAAIAIFAMTYTDFRKFLDATVPFITGYGLIAGATCGAAARAQATAHSDRIKT
jgi:hypothetical protein